MTASSEPALAEKKTQPTSAVLQGRPGVPGAVVAVVGVSISESCGVRDHATLLAQGLREQGVSCTVHWLQREPAGLRGSRAQVVSFIRGLRQELAGQRPDAILVHYSVFSYSYKGLPVFVRPLFSALRRTRLPVVAILHEFAYPWRRGDWRGAVWAVTQRVAMIGLMRTVAAAIVTTDRRVRWLCSRRWLPRREVRLAPVFSNLPAPTARASSMDGRAGERRMIGLFGYSYEGAAVSLVLDAIAELERRGVLVGLRLLGAPGADSASGSTWQAQASARGIGELVSFSGRLPAQSLSNELAACDVLLFADAAGPTPRKTTLAGSLASGRPVVALDGPTTWPELLHADALRVVPAAAGPLADALASLLQDPQGLDALGARGRAFYEREMALARTLATVLELLPASRLADPAAA
jgi:glycosyltransferase involved in cell wall biosynthesis